MADLEILFNLDCLGLVLTVSTKSSAFANQLLFADMATDTDNDQRQFNQITIRIAESKQQRATNGPTTPSKNVKFDNVFATRLFYMRKKKESIFFAFEIRDDKNHTKRVGTNFTSKKIKR